MRTVKFSLAIPASDYLRYYQGQVRSVSVISEHGNRIEFPAEHLRPFVTRDGVHGRFELVFDEGNRFVELRRV